MQNHEFQAEIARLDSSQPKPLTESFKKVAWDKLRNFDRKYLSEAIDYVIGENKKPAVSTLKDACFKALRDEKSKDAGAVTVQDIKPDPGMIPVFRDADHCHNWVSRFKKNCIGALLPPYRQHFNYYAKREFPELLDYASSLKRNLIDSNQDVLKEYAHVSSRIIIGTCLRVNTSRPDLPAFRE